MTQPDTAGGWIKPVSTIDSVTGLLNPQGWIGYAKRHLKRAVCSQQRLGLILFRVQNIEPVMKDLGRDVVQAGIQQVAEELQSLVRPGDLLGRWNDEDFIVLLPYVDASMIDVIAERLVYGVRKKPIIVGRQLLPFIVASGGASLIVRRGEIHELDVLISEVERNLAAVERH
jgi:diguanylate cyclase (GGDEF)-like protein